MFDYAVRIEQEASEELFDMVSCYFPLSFTPPRDDPRGVTRGALASGLERAMLACPIFVSMTLPLVETTLKDAENLKPDAATDMLAMVGAVSVAASAEELATHSGDLYRSLRRAHAKGHSRARVLAASSGFLRVLRIFPSSNIE